MGAPKRNDFATKPDKIKKSAGFNIRCRAAVAKNVEAAAKQAKLKTTVWIARVLERAALAELGVIDNLDPDEAE